MFYIVDFPTTILGIHDSESLKLITVHFDSVEAEISQVESSLKVKKSAPMYVNAIQNSTDLEEFSIKIKCDYKDLFTGIGNMNTVIDRKLRQCCAICSTNQKGCTCPTRTIAFRTGKIGG